MQSPPVQHNDPDTQMASEPTLSSLALLASSSQTPDQTYDDPSSSGSALKTKEQMRRHYIRTLHKVIDQSDIVILVLDARDPEGCRSRLVEEEVRRRESEGKKLVFVLNKIDLVPRANAQQWLRHLRHSTPTLPFRSATMNQRTNLSTNTAPSLVRLLKAYKPSAAQSVTVGVVGFPNVGKSSLINSLKRAKVCAVAAQPGHTKDLQSVQLERGIRIVDSPGVVFDEDEDTVDGKSSHSKGSILLRNVVKVEDIDDPIAVVEEILARTEPETIRKIYSLPEFSSTLEFLTMLALTSGRLLKGGTPDIIAASRHVLMDWNHQKIPYFSVPPAIHPSSIPTTIDAVIAPGAENVGQAQILTELSKPFELSGLFGAADAGAFGPVDEVMADGEQEDVPEPELMDEDGIAMESDDLAPSIPRKRSRSPSVATTVTPAANTNERTQRAPKRQRRAKDVPAYDAPVEEHARRTMARSNPLSRKVLKKEAKRARRDATKLLRSEGSGMEVDDGLSLEFTFMADTQGATA
ncbi:hypothetical protein PLICRDRAFT_38926 [Plicaturopsis crispa FD-325 SS-3]|nr:hypothetical protein PLICRDRAFT_38926 [Plicaturopsis crispa FD-325 SS-3]